MLQEVEVKKYFYVKDEKTKATSRYSKTQLTNNKKRDTKPKEDRIKRNTDMI